MCIADDLGVVLFVLIVFALNFIYCCVLDVCFFAVGFCCILYGFYMICLLWVGRLLDLLCWWVFAV